LMHSQTSFSASNRFLPALVPSCCGGLPGTQLTPVQLTLPYEILSITPIRCPSPKSLSRQQSSSLSRNVYYRLLSTLIHVAAATQRSTGGIAGIPTFVLRKEVDLGRDKVRANPPQFFQKSPELNGIMSITT